MEEDLTALDRNHTWTLTPFPAGRTAVKSRWIYKRKPKVDGSIERYKARLVAKGYYQRLGVVYDQTYSPVVKYDSLQVILAMAAAEDMELFQLDVTTHITQVSPVDVQKMSISDIGPILWMSVGEPRNILTAETEIQWMSFFKFLSALASATGCSSNIRNRHIPDKISTC
jgi:hypothetical protein